MTYSLNFLKTYQRIALLLMSIAFTTVVIAFNSGHDAMYWLSYWWMFPIAFAIAIIVNTAGISGAALFVPFFILIFPLLTNRTFNGIESVKLGLITESFGLSSSAIAFFAYGLTDTKIAFKTILTSLPFVAIGAVVSSFIPESALYFILASLLLISIILLRSENKIKAHQEKEGPNTKKIIDFRKTHGEHTTLRSKDGKIYHYSTTKEGGKKLFIGYSIGGFTQGSAGFGIGELGIVSMILSGLPTRVAIGTSHFIIAATALAGSIIHVLTANAFNEEISWNILIITVPAVILGGQLAPLIAAKLSNKILVKFISILFGIIALALVALIFKT